MMLESGGELIAVETDLSWVGRLIGRAVGATGPTRASASSPGSPMRRATVRLHIQSSAAGFATSGMRPITRGAYSNGKQTVLADVGGSGFDLLIDLADELDVVARYRPRAAVRAANLLLSRRFALLVGQVLVHYPVIWRSGWRGNVPLHASVARTSSGTPMLAGPGGVGKSTVLVEAVAEGATLTADNLCCADGTWCFGVAEPMRVDLPASHGRHTSHGRVEAPLVGRDLVLRPDRLVVLERGPRTEVEPVTPGEAARALVAGTYAAGELRRYWAFAATLALATGRGPAHPAVAEVANRFAEQLPCWRIRVGDDERVPLARMAGEVG